MMWKYQLMNIVKTSPIIMYLYRLIGNSFFRFLGLFVKTDEKLILFNCFGGKKYDDSPKAVYQFMKNDARFSEYKMVWAFHNPDSIQNFDGISIKTDDLNYFITALKARIWVSNSGIERGLSFKKKRTLYINTWHGTPIKYMGSDAMKISPSRMKPANRDIQNAQSKYEADIFSRTYRMSPEKFLICGYPRNDILAGKENKRRDFYKELLGIPKDKCVILYAPTFRDYERDKKRSCVMKPPIHFERWRKILGEEYVVLMRCHYEVSRLLNVNIDGNFVRDVSSYPVLNDLMLASDILISDYSSILFDYAILERPIIIYAYDYDAYKKRRGVYIDVRKELPDASAGEDDLIVLLQTLNMQKAIAMVRQFREKYVTSYGSATKATVDALWHFLNG